MVYNKNSIVSSIGKNRKFPEKHQRFGFSILSELGRFAIIIGLRRILCEQNSEKEENKNHG